MSLFTKNGTGGKMKLSVRTVRRTFFLLPSVLPLYLFSSDSDSSFSLPRPPDLRSARLFLGYSRLLQHNYAQCPGLLQNLHPPFSPFHYLNSSIIQYETIRWFFRQLKPLLNPSQTTTLSWRSGFQVLNHTQLQYEYSEVHNWTFHLAVWYESSQNQPYLRYISISMLFKLDYSSLPQILHRIPII